MFIRRALTFVLAVVWLWPAAAHGQSPALEEAYNRFVDLYSQGHYEEALPFAEEAVRLSEREFGPDHTSVAQSLNNLAELYRAQGRYEAAEPLFKRALAIAEKALGPDHPDVATRSVEGFGIAYVEAAFRALPTVAGRSGGVADAVLDGVTGLLCDGNDACDVERAIRDCLADPGRRTQLGIAARQRAEREFTWPVAAKRYLACLDRIAS